MSTAVKWVTVKSGVLRATDEARNRLIKIREGQPLNVLTIVGAARCGKSFLMNALTGFDDMFRVSPDVAPCTAGADLSPILMPLSDFERGGGGNNSSSPEPTIAFVDMEGQGDQSAGHDVRLATPFLLLSQVVIFNWLGLPNKNTILQRLVVMIKAGRRVMGREDEREPAFGHLILLMRDVKGKTAEIEALVMDDEDAGDLTFDDAKDVLERNRIRKGLRAAFKSIIVHTMNRPHPEIADGAVPLTEVSPGFTASLDQLRGIIAEHLTTPHTFGGEPITGGQRLHDIVGGLCEMVNSTGDICPLSVLEAIDTRQAHEELHSALDLFDAMLDSVKNGEFVLSTREAAVAISDARERAFEQFDQATQGISSRIPKEVRKELLKNISPKAKVVAGSQEAKRRELATKMQTLVSRSEARFSRAELARWNATNVRDSPTGITERELEKRWDIVTSRFISVLQGDLKKMATVDGDVNEALLAELGWALSKKQFEGLVEGTHKQVQGLNRAAVAREKDRKAKEEADRKAAQLAEQNDRLQKEKDDADARAIVARRERDEAREQRSPPSFRGGDQIYPSLAFSPFAYQPSYVGGGGGWGGGGGGGGGGRNLRWYPGGQFIPGGGRSPAGGGFF